MMRKISAAKPVQSSDWGLTLVFCGKDSRWQFYECTDIASTRRKISTTTASCFWSFHDAMKTQIYVTIHASHTQNFMNREVIKTNEEKLSISKSAADNALIQAGGVRICVPVTEPVFEEHIKKRSHTLTSKMTSRYVQAVLWNSHQRWQPGRSVLDVSTS